MEWLRRLLGPRPTASDAPRPPAPFESYGSVAGLPDGAVFGAGYTPGFAPDLSCWRLWVYPDGRVWQELRVSTAGNGYAAEERVVEGRVDPTVAAGLVAAAEVAGLAGLTGRYESDCTDQCRVSVCARLPCGVRSAAVYGPYDLAGQGHAGAVIVLALWLAAHRSAPWRPAWMSGPDALPGTVQNSP